VSFNIAYQTHDREALVVDLAGELEVDAAENCALLAVDLERARDLLDDVREVARLEGRIDCGCFCTEGW
jgi:hypothetical protein